jgi:hypothetical protein
MGDTHGHRVSDTHGPCVSDTRATVGVRHAHKRPQREEHPGPGCTHRWRTPDGDCPVCLAAQAAG